MRERFCYDLTLLNEDVLFITTATSYEVSTPSYGRLQLIRAQSVQPELPQGRTFFRSYLWARGINEYYIFEQEFIDLKPQGWKLVAKIVPREDLSSTERAEFYDYFLNQELNQLIESRPWAQLSPEEPEEVRYFIEVRRDK